MAGGVGVKPLVKVPFVLFLAMFVHITVMASIHIDHVRPDVLLLVTIVSGLVCGSEQGAGIGFVLGVFADLTLQTPFGLSALVLTLVGFGVGTLQSLILRSSWWIPPATAVVARNASTGSRTPARSAKLADGGAGTVGGPAQIIDVVQRGDAAGA